jgi:CRISPR-associated endonuclease Cas1
VDATPFYRLRWLLRMNRPTRLPCQHHAVLYAVLCAAAKAGPGEAESAIPEGLLLDAPEAARTELDAGENYSFGATWIGEGPSRVAAIAHQISAGLGRVGQKAPKEGAALGGNFELVELRDLVADRPLAPGDVPTPVSRERISRELEALLDRSGRPITLQFLSPLRLELPGREGDKGHRHADERHLNVGQLLRAVQRRLTAIGVVRPDQPQATQFSDEAITLLENQLVWLDLEYGPWNTRKAIGGAVGRVIVRVHDPSALAALVWGQYARVGRNLRFGLGRYRIEELGPDPTATPRAASPLDLCLAPAHLEAAARDHGLDPAALQLAARELREGTYVVSPPHRVTLRELDGGQRVLLVPSRRDRALQRLVLRRIGPALDQLFETSSFAWRRGLSREAAARRIERLANDGWRFAVRADFDRFFERIPQGLLQARLEAALADGPLVQTILRFVRGGCPDGRGVPTGAPLSPLLGNLLLDSFDERVELDGGRLVRYADDFLILTRDRDEAERLHARSRQLAQDLRLQLNDDSKVLDLQEPFTFLGFEFRQEERWEYAGADGPRLVRELGWKDADRAPSPLNLQLPGEAADPVSSGVIVVGPGLESLECVGDDLQARFSGNQDGRRVPLAGMDRLVVLGPARWAPDVPGRLLHEGIATHLVSEQGWPLGELLADGPDDPEAIQAQCQARADPARVLVIARGLVAAKLLNHAALLRSADASRAEAIERLVELAGKAASAESVESLMGFEGSGAGTWYRCLPGLLGPGFHFPRRVSPDARDPVNVLLNIGHTMLYRHAVSACRAAGLSPAVGFLHVPSARFAALAADLQEPFRHLVERAVILATRRLKPNQFLPRDDGPYALVLEHRAARTYHAVLQRSWQLAVVGNGQTEGRPYLGQMIHTARALRRHLIDPEQPWGPFQHP